jgi:DNA polymerase elongation subunit (family B)
VEKSPGFVGEFVAKFKKVRKQMKQDLKSASGVKKAELSAAQDAIKIINNSLYGSMIGGHFHNTSPMIGIFVTAAGRELARILHKTYESNVLAVDTDGLVFRDVIPAEEANHKIANFLKKKYQRGTIDMVLEAEYTDTQVSMLLSKKKNYYLYQNGKVTAYGSSLTTSRNPQFIETMMSEIVRRVFEDVNENRASSERLSEYEREAIQQMYSTPLSTFLLSIRVTRDLLEYKNIGPMSQRVKIIAATPGLNDDGKKREIRNLLEIRIMESNIEGATKERLLLIITRAEKVAFDTYLHRILELCYRELDPLIGTSYGSSARLLDLYHTRHGSYPIKGESIEYYYSIRTGNVDLGETLQDRSMLDIPAYTDLLAGLVDIVRGALPKEEDDLFDLS